MTAQRRDRPEGSPSHSPEPSELEVGGLSRAELSEALRAGGMLMNAHAETLLAHPVFDEQARQRIHLVYLTVAELGLDEGATLPRIFTRAEERGLAVCPGVTGPYLRLAWTAQTDSSNSVLSAGHSPDGAVYVAAPLLKDDVEYPRGFYLRAVDGRLWLRGYRCDDLYVLAPDVRLVFRQLP